MKENYWLLQQELDTDNFRQHHNKGSRQEVNDKRASEQQQHLKQQQHWHKPAAKSTTTTTPPPPPPPSAARNNNRGTDRNQIRDEDEDEDEINIVFNSNNTNSYNNNNNYNSEEQLFCGEQLVRRFESKDLDHDEEAIDRSRELDLRCAADDELCLLKAATEATAAPRQEQQPLDKRRKKDENDDTDRKVTVQPQVLNDESHDTKRAATGDNNATINDINLSFCGCGFLGIYHVGVASCFHQYAPQLSMHKIAGSSAGALVAVAHICGNLQLAYATTDILRVAIDARARALGPFHPSFDINATVRKALERGLPEDVHVRASGKLHVSLTRCYDGANVIISQFDSKDEVIQALLCSCFIPFWSGLSAPKFRGTTYIDGGFSNNQLILDNKTVTVSPFAGEADICPQDDNLNLLQISLSNTSFSISPNNLYRLSHALLPPPPEVLSDLCEQGFADGIKFLQRMKLISCTKCLEIRSSLLVTTNGEDMEEAFSLEVNRGEANRTPSIIRLEQQEQKMIEINAGIDQAPTRRKSVSSSSSASQQLYHHRHQVQAKKLQRSAAAAAFEENCNECVIKRQRARHDRLPSQLSDRIRDACDAVNKSLSNWIYSYRPVKYLSYMALAPVDISLALLLRCWQELPLIRSELVNFMCSVARFLLNLIRRIHSRSTSALLMGDAEPFGADHKLDKDALEYEKDLARFRLTTSASSIDCKGGDDEHGADDDDDDDADKIDAASSQPLSPPHPHHPNLSCCRHHHPQVVVTASDGEQCEHDGNSLSGETPLRALSGDEEEDDDGDDEQHQQATGNEMPKFIFPQPTSISLPTSPASTNQQHSLEDTFDSIVDVTSNQEARIFAYYFRDAKNRLQVTEIFDLERAAELCHLSTTHHATN